jgi:hypothetical protein
MNAPPPLATLAGILAFALAATAVADPAHRPSGADGPGWVQRAPSAPEPWLLPSDPQVRSAETARQVTEDLLDGAEALLQIFDFGRPEEESSLLWRIEQLRELLHLAPPEQLQQMADTMGPDLARLHEAMKSQVAIMTALAEREEPGAPLPALPKSAGFPQLDPNLPDYPAISGQSLTIGVFVEIFSEATIRQVLEMGGWIQEHVDIPLCVTQLNPDGRAARMSNDLQLIAEVVNDIVNIRNDVQQDICGGASVDITIVSLGYGCGLCCIVDTLLTGVANLIHESVMLCQDMINDAELEAAWHAAKTTLDGVEHVHGDVEHVQDTADAILDIVTCTPVAELLWGHGCDGVDNDCDGAVDEADEDVVPPVLHADRAVSQVWHPSTAAAMTAVEKAVLAFDDCRGVSVSASAVGSCGDAKVTVVADDGLNAASLTVPVQVDAAPPTVTIPASIADSCHDGLEAAETAVLAAATVTDDCTPGGLLDVRVDSTVTECALRVRIEAVDRAGQRSHDAVTVRVDTRPPAVEVGRLELVQLLPPCFETVAEAEEAVRSVTRVRDDCSAAAALAPVVSSTGDPCGLVVTAAATDDCDHAGEAEAVLRVDDAPPIVTASVATDSLWPPNHGLVDVGLSFTADDDCGGDTAIQVRVTSDESPSAAGGAGDEWPDAVVQRAPDGTVTGVLLRAERESPGNGRVYRITVEATDPCGHVGRAFAEVSVPRQSHAPAVDDGQYHDPTLGGCS